MIGVFGATVSCIVVIKTIGDRKVTANLETAEARIKGVEMVSSGDVAIEVCSTHRNNICTCRTAFRFLSLIPIVMFTLWAFSTAIYVSFSNTCEVFESNQPKAEKHEAAAEEVAEKSKELPIKPESSFSKWLRSVLFSRSTIAIVTIIDIILILVALWFLRYAGTELNKIELQYATVLDENQ